MQQPSSDYLNQNDLSSAKTAISDVETTALRLEIVALVKNRLEQKDTASNDFLEFERDVVILGVLESLVKLKNRAETDSTRTISRKILEIIEEKYDVLASKKNKFLKLRDLSWDRVFGIIPEIRIILKSKPTLLFDTELFIAKVKEKCAYPYQYYWLLESRAKDPRSNLTTEEQFLLAYLRDYDKAINRNTKEVVDHYKQQNGLARRFDFRNFFKSN